MVSLKKYINSLILKFKTKIEIDYDFYEEENFYLIDYEV